MRNLFLVFSVVIFSYSSYAQNSEILNCQVTNTDWSAKFILDSIGSGFLKFKKAGDPKSYTCSLKLEFIQDGKQAVSPHITIDFVRGACEPNLGLLEQDILENFGLIINVRQKDKPQGKVQWLKKKQPEPCQIEKIRMFDISMNAKKWRNGTWGRNTASESKNTQRTK